jgi:hypothetical protein
LKCQLWEVLEPVRQGLARHFGGLKAEGAQGLPLRHDHGQNYMTDDFQQAIRFLGMSSSPAFVRQTEGNSVTERAIRTLKEQLLWVPHEYSTPNPIRAAQQRLASSNTMEFKLAV